MTSKNNKNTNKTAATKRASSKNIKKGKRSNKSELRMTVGRPIGKSEHAQALAMLIAHPCDALVDSLPGVTGETVIRRIRSIISVHRTAANNTGYLLWYPEYHGLATTGGGDNSNLFMWEVVSTDSNLRPTNTTLNPLGSDSTTASHVAGDFYPDPASSLVSPETSTTTTPFASACTLAACMKYCYSGTLSSNSGFVYPVEDLPVTTFFNQNGGLTGTANGAVSFANLQTYAKTRARIPLEGVEVAWRPKKYLFRGPGETNSTLGLNNAADTLFTQGVISVTSRTILQAADPTDVSGFGIAWNGLQSTTNNDVFIECVKVVELQLRPTAGMIEERPATAPSPSYLEAAKEMLDNMNPNWQVHLSNLTSHAAARITTTALAGASALLRQSGNRVLRDRMY